MSKSAAFGPDTQVLLATLAVFALVGGVTGWLVGSSSSPVISAVIPVVGGLLGALSVNLIGRYAREKQTLGKAPQYVIASALSRRLAATRHTIFMVLLSTVCFLVVFLVGEQVGVNIRSLHTPRFTEMVDRHQLRVSDLDAESQTQVYRLYIALRALRAEGQDFNDVCDRLLKPLTELIVNAAVKANETHQISDQAVEERKKAELPELQPSARAQLVAKEAKAQTDFQNAEQSLKSAKAALKALVEGLEGVVKASVAITAPGQHEPLGN